MCLRPRGLSGMSEIIIRVKFLVNLFSITGYIIALYAQFLLFLRFVKIQIGF